MSTPAPPFACTLQMMDWRAGAPSLHTEPRDDAKELKCVALTFAAGTAGAGAGAGAALPGAAAISTATLSAEAREAHGANRRDVLPIQANLARSRQNG